MVSARRVQAQNLGARLRGVSVHTLSIFCEQFNT